MAIAGRGNVPAPQERRALRRLVDRERRRSLLVQALAFDRPVRVKAMQMAARAGIDLGEAEQEARRLRHRGVR